MSYNIKAPSERAVKNGPVAQLGERTVRIRKVESSILFGSTKNTAQNSRNGLSVRCFVLKRFGSAHIKARKTEKIGLDVD